MTDMQNFYTQMIATLDAEVDSYHAALRAISQLSADAIRRLELTTPWLVWDESVK